MITIGFSSHHLEALPYARHQMRQHQILVLEEAPVPEFLEMLDGRLSIDEYMMTLDSGFPEFEGRMCSLLRELHHEGRQVIQVEPYLERLLQIHEILSDGKPPQDIMTDSRFGEVYEAEKRATGALITYYAHALEAPFGEVVQSVKAVARADADRLALRGRLRAQTIKPLRLHGVDIYVEAGYIHYSLYCFLRKALGGGQRIRVVYLLAPEVRRLGGKRRNMGPGDILTLHYALHGRLSENVADLLAARSLIYVKLIKKDELLPGDSTAPHSEDEASVNRVVDRLSIEDCRALFGKMRLARGESAHQVLTTYLAQSSRK